MSEVVRTPAYDESSESAPKLATQQPEEEEKKENMIHALVRLAGPVPNPVPKLPSSVIIPQRRPGK